MSLFWMWPLTQVNLLLKNIVWKKNMVWQFLFFISRDRITYSDYWFIWIWFFQFILFVLSFLFFSYILLSSLSPILFPLLNSHFLLSLLLKFLFFNAILGFELRASHLLGRLSATWATLPALLGERYFQDRVSWTICPGLTSGCDPPDLCLQGS
jgi:hypothetical protein